MNDRPDYVVACERISVVMYPDSQAVGVQITDPAGQKLFVSLPGDALEQIGAQLQNFAREHPEVLNWRAVPYQP